MSVETGVSLLDAALEYAARGWRVFPLHSPKWLPSNLDGPSFCSCGHTDCDTVGKHPRTPNGLKDATSDAEQIREWWTKWPDANIGFATGEGIQVLDVDGQVGADSLTCLETEFGLLPPTLECRTGRDDGGRHLYFKFDGELGNSAGKLGSKLDTRGQGGYVILPPSTHRSGRRYEWVNDAPLLNMPRWLIDKVQRPATTLVEFVLRDHTKKHEVNYGIHKYYAKWFDNKCMALRNTPPGGSYDSKGQWKGRNERLYDMALWAGTCVQAGLGDATFVENEIKSAARGCGLAEREINASWLSGWENGWLKPPLEDPPDDWDKPDKKKQQEPERPKSKSSLKFTKLSRVTRQHVDYLWGDRLVQQAVNLLIGDGGLGKSAVALHIALSFTNGVPLPDDKGQRVDGDVMLVTYEDPPDLVAMRAKVLGIDFERFVVLEGQHDEDGRLMPFNKDSVPALIDAMEDYPNTRLLIIDPWGRYLDDDDHKEKLIRRAIAPLEELARKCNLTVILVGHTNKSTEYSSAEHRIAGHSAFKNVARSVLMIGKFTESQLAVAHVKHNWSSPAPAVFYTWDADKSWKDGENPLSWGEVTDLNPDELFAARKQSKTEEAKTWLRRQLIGGAKSVSDIEEAAEEDKIAHTTLHRASKELGVIKTRRGNQPGDIGATWSLPSANSTEPEPVEDDWDDEEPF